MTEVLRKIMRRSKLKNVFNKNGSNVKINEAVSYSFRTKKGISLTAFSQSDSDQKHSRSC